MDDIFLELVGKPKLNPPKLITIAANNFTFAEDQAIFLRAVLAIPSVKQLPLDCLTKRLIQLGPIQHEVSEQVKKEKWNINQYVDLDENVCDRLASDVSDLKDRSMLFINDVSKLELSCSNSSEVKDFLRFTDRLKRKHGHFIVMLYQNSTPNSPSKLLRDLEYLSDAFISARSCKSCYLLSTWHQKIPDSKSLIPTRVETAFYTCKIGKFYWSSDLLCFYDKKKVARNFNPDHENSQLQQASGDESEDADGNLDTDMAGRLNLGDEDEALDVESTLPYMKARNPEASRIFYYPDKEDDVDEDDPDSDLNI